MKQIILASSSPRRKALLEQAGLKFTIYPSDFEEVIDKKLTPTELAEKLSLEKAKTVYHKFPNSTVIAADTFVFCQKKILGKPKDKKNAKEMLHFLSDKSHEIITGFTIIDGEKIITKSEKTFVKMKLISDKEMDEYISTDEPFGKAGAYAIQGLAKKFIAKIEGDLSNAIGLPVNLVLQELKKLGVK